MDKMAGPAAEAHAVTCSFHESPAHALDSHGQPSVQIQPSMPCGIAQNTPTSIPSMLLGADIFHLIQGALVFFP